MSKFIQRLERELQSRCQIGRGENIMAAISGGLDSMTLLAALQSLAGNWRWKIVVAHFNHQLRGRSSDADEQLVRRMAGELDMPFVSGRADVKQFAKSSKLSLEMAARKLRHEFFARVAAERGISTVALAHHADDQVELFFLRILRGAGGAGLGGMKWRSPSPINPKIMLVRPLLGFSKADIRGFARANNVAFRKDATNFSKDILRNRIRNELLPRLRRHYQPGLARTVLRLMEITGAEAETVGGIASRWLRRRRPGFGELPVAVQRRVLFSQLAESGLSPEFELVESLRQVPGVAVDAGPNISVSRDTAGRVTLRTILPVVGFKTNQLALTFKDRAGEAEFDGAVLSWRFQANHQDRPLQKKSGREVFDADKVGGNIILRHWRPGDRFQPIGLKTAAKLQDLFTNAKISRDRRRGLIVAAAADGGLFWVEGLRISENFKLTAATRRRLVWQWRRRE